MQVPALEWLSGPLSSVFRSPAGLAALLGIVPLLVLYLLKPDPERLELPTARFLLERRERDTRLPGLRNLQRTLLLLLQILVVVALAVSLAAPYVDVSERRTVEETVIVVDASASMATSDDGTTRFEAATAAGREAVTDRTSVVVAGPTARTALRRGPPAEARETLSELRPSGAPGDLRSAIRRATSIAGEDARIVVLSDFADDSDWKTAVRVARGTGQSVTLRQFDRGGEDNVGIVAASFDDRTVTATVRNFGTSDQTRTVSLGERSESVTLSPGDATTVEFPVPPGGGRLELSPRDSLATDDVVPVAAPDDPTIDVLLLTNEGNRRLATALRVIDPVDLTVKRPPASVADEYDVVIFGAVTPGRVLEGSVEAARETLSADGGVVVQARRNVSAAGYGDLLIVEPDGIGTDARLSEPADDPLTRGIAFPEPDRYLRGTLTRGRALVSTTRGTPVLATATVGDGRVLYYGYFGNGSVFRYNYLFPVFWQRAVFDLSGRPSLASLNRQTGGSIATDGGVAETPRGRYEGSTVPLRDVGVYRTGDRQYAAALRSPAESDVRDDRIETGPDGVQTGRSESETVPRDLTHFAVAAAVLLVLLELAYLSSRGDL